MSSKADTHLPHRLAVIREFQCPGCLIGGPDPVTCGSLRLDEIANGTDTGFHCGAHVTGTAVGMPGPSGRVALGLPKGFDKVGALREDDLTFKRITNIRLWTEMPAALWNRLNLPVWAMFQSGAVFVRTYAPRINVGYVDVIKNDRLSQKDVDLLMEQHGTIDVATFLEDID